MRAGLWWGNGEAITLMGTPHTLGYGDPAPDRGFPVSIRNVHFRNIICTTENALGVVGTGDNVRDIHFDGLSVELKESDNLPLKGRLIDLSPDQQEAFLPDDGPYWLHLQGARDISVDHAYIAPFRGQQPRVSQKDCRDISINAAYTT